MEGQVSNQLSNRAPSRQQHVERVLALSTPALTGMILLVVLDGSHGVAWESGPS